MRNLIDTQSKKPHLFQNQQNDIIQSLNRKCQNLPKKNKKGMLVWDEAHAIPEKAETVRGVELVFTKNTKVVHRQYFTSEEMIAAPIEWILFVDGLIEKED